MKSFRICYLSHKRDLCDVDKVCLASAIGLTDDCAMSALAPLLSDEQTFRKCARDARLSTDGSQTRSRLARPAMSIGCIGRRERVTCMVLELAVWPSL
jgi:hypothetical protein